VIHLSNEVDFPDFPDNLRAQPTENSKGMHRAFGTPSIDWWLTLKFQEICQGNNIPFF
jgi:hypothetical protein